MFLPFPHMPKSGPRRGGFSIFVKGQMISPTPFSESNPNGIDWLLDPDEEAVIGAIRMSLERHGRDFTAYEMDRYDRPYPLEKELDQRGKQWQSIIIQEDQHRRAYYKGWMPQKPRPPGWIPKKALPRPKKTPDLRRSHYDMHVRDWLRAKGIKPTTRGGRQPIAFRDLVVTQTDLDILWRALL